MLDPAAVNAVMTEHFPGIPGMCQAIGPDFAVVTSTPGDGDLRPGGFISGPTQFALADAALWYLVFGAIGRVEIMALTSELSIRYLRPAVGRTLTARADLAGAGRRNVVGTVTVWTDDNTTKPCAVAQGTYALPLTDRPATSGPGQR